MKRLLLVMLAALPALAAPAIDFSDPGALVETALASHPALVRARADAAAAHQRIQPAAALPNPMLMGGIQNKQIDLSDDAMMTMVMVGASQTFTRRDRREARRAVAESSARALDQELASVRAELERDVLLAWYDLAAIDGQLQSTAEVRELIDAVIAAARVRYEVGSAAQADVIRAQLQQSSLDRDILRLRGARRAAAARLLPLLGLPETTEIPPVKMPEETDDLPSGASSVPPADHPAIAALEAGIAGNDDEIRLARLDRKPDVGLEAQYGYRRSQPDMFSVVARIEVPLRRDQTIEPRIREALSRREASTSRVEELRRSLARDLGEAAAAHDEATEQLKLYEEVLVPQSKLAFDSTLAAYQTGQAPFDAILTTETGYLRLQLQYLDLLGRHAQAVVNYRALRRGARSASITAGAAVASAGDSAPPSTMGGM